MLRTQIAGAKTAFPRWLKWASSALAALICAVIVLYGLLAAGLSNAALQSRLEDGLAAWSGLQVQSGGGVKLSLFPPKATLSGVKAASALPGISMEADRVSVSFSLLSLLTKQPVMREIEVSGGQVTLDVGKPLNLAGLANAASFKNALEAAAQANGTMPKGVAPGVLRFSDTNWAVRWPTGQLDTVKDLEGTFRWLALNSAASLSASGMWRGEAARLEIRSEEPLKLLAGLESNVSAQLTSAPVSFNYAGKLSNADKLLAEGQVKIRAQSPKSILNWIGISSALPENQGVVDLDARLSHADGKLALNDLKMALDGNPASGMLVFDPSLATPLVSGTLAFEKADLGSLVAAFQPAVQDIALHGLDLDLRFSAETVQASALVLTNAAGTIKVSGNDTLLDLGSSRFAGGECVGSLKFSGPAGKREGIVKLSVRDVMADQLAAYDPSFPQLSAPLSAQVEASGAFHDWAQFIRQANGRLKVTVGEGVARNFSTETLSGLVSAGTVFSLAETYAGLTPVISGELNGTLSGGAAIINSADLQFASHRLRFSGAVPLMSGGVALSGQIGPAGSEASGLPFFVGGVWSRPFVTMGRTSQ